MMKRFFLKKLFSIVVVSSLIACNVNMQAAITDHPAVKIVVITACSLGAGASVALAIKNIGWLTNIGGHGAPRFSEASLMGFERNCRNACNCVKAAASFLPISG